MRKLASGAGAGKKHITQALLREAPLKELPPLLNGTTTTTTTVGTTSRGVALELLMKEHMFTLGPSWWGLSRRFGTNRGLNTNSTPGFVERTDYGESPPLSR